jgi:hypothetical protein
MRLGRNRRIAEMSDAELYRRTQNAEWDDLDK